MMKSRLILTIWNQLKKLAKTRSRTDWKVVGSVGLVLLFILLFVTSITPYQPTKQQLFYQQDQSQSHATYLRGEVLESPKDGIAVVRLLDGERSGQVTEVIGLTAVESMIPKVGETVIVSQGTAEATQDVLFFVDRFRIPGVVVLMVLLIGLVALIGGRRGVSSIAGLLLSFAVIGWLIIPLILSGYDPFWTILAGSYLIAVASILVSHGMRRRTYISIACICLVLTMVAILVGFVMWLIGLSGIADESTFFLLMGREDLDLRGVMAGGMIIATLGVLDDVVTTQVATVEELHRANNRQSRRRLFLAASSVGTEHIASIINTLALAYTGASLPFILLLASQSQSTFLILNGEYITTEIVRTLVASIGLIIAIPISTFVATLIYKRVKI